MGILKKLRKLVEAVNTYYAFALIAYAFALFVLGHSTVFVWILVVATPLLAAWGGYLLRSVVEQRAQRYGFKVVSDSMSYEIGSKHSYTLRYTTKLQATADHLMVYPIGYNWSGNGTESMPKLTHDGQQLLAPITSTRKQATPYQALTVSSEGNWRYWFIAFNPPIHKDNDVEIKYSQNFQDNSGVARPYMYYYVRTSMKTLELSVKFPPHAQPKNVSSGYVKASDPNRPYKKPGVVYDEDKQWATWTINKPKRGYYYRIDWQ